MIFTLLNEEETEYICCLLTKVLISIIPKKIVIDASQGKSIYINLALTRNTGYLFEITIAEKDLIPETSNDSLKGALVEVYKNTKGEEPLVIERYRSM